MAAAHRAKACDGSFSAKPWPRPMMPPAIAPEINAEGIVAAGPATRWPMKPPIGKLMTAMSQRSGSD